MKKIWYFATGVFMLIALISGFGYWFYAPHPDGKYDNNNYLVKSAKMDLERVRTAVVHIEATTEYIGEDGEEYTAQRFVGGVVIAKRYILSVAHGISKNDEVEVEMPDGIETMPAKIVSRTVSILDRERKPIVPISVIYLSYEKDIAFYELPKGLFMDPFPYAIGNSDELKEGNFVYIVGYSLGHGTSIRDGIVSALRWQSRRLFIPSALREHFFMVNTGIIPNDSGTPIIAVRDGMFELVGIASSTNLSFSELGVVVRVNEIRKAIEACIACPGDLRRVFAVSRTNPTLMLVK